MVKGGFDALLEPLVKQAMGSAKCGTPPAGQSSTIATEKQKKGAGMKAINQCLSVVNGQLSGRRKVQESR